MTLPGSVKGSGTLPLLVAVISSRPELLRATRLRQLPDLFELRLDALAADRRRDLLRRFLPHATFVDVELRSAEQLRAILEATKRQDVRRIISVHELHVTPPADRLQMLADAAAATGADLFKIATRTDTPDEIDRLLSFFDSNKGGLAISAMGIGKLGRVSRRLLAARGSALNYAHLGTSAAEGQFSLAEMRRVLRGITRSSAISRLRRSV